MDMVLLLLSCTKTYTQEEIDKLFEPITSKYGIKIVYAISADYPPLLIGGERAKFSVLEQIDNNTLAHYGDLLRKALNKYPIHVIKSYLSAICFAKTMQVDGVYCGGTYDQFRHRVYLTNNGQLSDDRAIANFHHEFSSLLLSRNGFFLNNWYRQNPQKFSYLDENHNDWSEVTLSLEATKTDYKKGFMNNYSQTNFENDFNEYAAMIFTHPQKFKKIMNQYPRVRGKFLLFLDFYHKIDPIFTEAYLLGEQ